MALTHQGETNPVDDVEAVDADLSFLASRRGAGKSELLHRLARFGTGPWMFVTDLLAVISGPLILGQGIAASTAFTALYLTLAAAALLYQSQLKPSVLDDLPQLLSRLTIAATVTYILSSSGTSTVAQLNSGFGRAWWLAAAASGLALICSRALVTAAVREARRHYLIGHRTLIVGAGHVAVELAAYLKDHSEYGLRPTAFYDPKPFTGMEYKLPVLSQTSLSDAVISSKSVTIVVAFASIPESELVEFIHDSHRTDAEIFFVPRLFEVASMTGRDLERVRALPLQRLKRAPHRSPTWRLKGVMDRVLASLILLLASPILIAIAASVLISLGRPFIFRQTRIGLDGRQFGILKFRTLPNTESLDSDKAWAAETSRKPTRVGSFLRASSLDELPQLVNILKGEMSFVGPRPERPHFVGEFATEFHHYSRRHRVPSGLTGLAQINGLRGDTSISERTRFDNTYVETWSLWGDIKILLRTIRLLLPRSGR